MKKITFILLNCLVLLTLAGCTSSTYYLDSVNGDDTNCGRLKFKAWRSLSKVRQLQLKPGDKVLLKRGGTYVGELEISGQGTPDNRIYIGAYGEGDKPCIVGNDTSLYAVRIFNSDYVTLKDVEIVNTGKERKPHRTGLKIECKDYGVSKNIVVDGVVVRDVNGSLVKEEGGGSGILIVNGGKNVISVFDRLTIENCRILRCSRNGMIWSGYSSRENWHPSKHTVIRKNLIEEVPGDGIVPIGCDSTLIEYNVMRNCPDILPATEAAAGIWPWSCDNTIIQYNEVSDHKAPWDGQGFDSDWNCRNTKIQYNYSHDNDGGMVLICNSGESPASFNAGNVGTVVRYNISLNDGGRTRPTRVGMFSPSIHLAGPVKKTYIYRNIIHFEKIVSREVDNSIMTFDSWGGYPDSTYVHENVFRSYKKNQFNLTESTNNVFMYNFYIGMFTKRPNDKLGQLIFADYLIPDLLETVEVAGTFGRFVKRDEIYKLFEQRISPIR